MTTFHTHLAVERWYHGKKKEILLFVCHIPRIYYILTYQFIHILIALKHLPKKKICYLN